MKKSASLYHSKGQPACTEQSPSGSPNTAEVANRPLSSEELLTQLKAASVANDNETQAALCHALGQFYQAQQETRHTPLAEDYLIAIFYYQLALAFYAQLPLDPEERATRQAPVWQSLTMLHNHFLARGLGLSASPPAVTVDTFQAQVATTRRQLGNIREQAKVQMDKLGAPPAARGEGSEQAVTAYVTKVKGIYHELRHALLAFLRAQWEDCVKELQAVGMAPLSPSDYAVMLFGSAADGLLTPYSDMEWGILMAEVDKKQPPFSAEALQRRTHYLQWVTQLMHQRVLNVGETTPRIMQQGHQAIAQSPVPNGLSFDGAGDGGCKNPLGKVKDGKPVFSLIQTPTGLANYLTLAWFQRERLLPSSLVNVSLLVGNARLVEAYQEAATARLAQPVAIANVAGQPASAAPITLREYIGQQLLAADLSRFKPKGGKAEAQGRTCSVKHDFYRLPNMVINQLALAAGLIPKSGDDIWQRVTHLQAAGYWSEQAARDVQWALAQAGVLRLQCYLALQEQAETAVVTDTGQVVLRGERQAAQAATFSLDQQRLFDMYYVLVPFFHAVHQYSATMADTTALVKTSQTGFYDHGPRTLGYIHHQLLKFTEAEAYYEQALQAATSQGGHEAEIAKRQLELGVVRQEGENALQGLKDMEAALATLKRYRGEMNIEVGENYWELGKAYAHHKQEDKARDYLIHAQRIFTELCGSEHPQTVKCKFALGQLVQWDEVKLAAQHVPATLSAYYARQDTLSLPFSGLQLSIEESYINLAIIREAEQTQKEEGFKDKAGKDKERNEGKHRLSLEEEESPSSADEATIEAKEPAATSPQVNDQRLTSYEELYVAKTPVKVTALFDPPTLVTAKGNNDANDSQETTVATEKNTSPPQKLVIWGRAGIGKSTLCQYIAHQWSQGKLWADFHAVFWIPLRYLVRYAESTTGDSRQDMAGFLHDVLIKQGVASEQLLGREHLTRYLTHAADHKVLFLLDGLDEAATLLNKTDTLAAQLLDGLLKQTYYLLTSRPGYRPPQVSEREARFELLGYTNDDIPRYVQQIYQALQRTPTQTQQLISFLQENPGAWGAAHVPINLALICTTFDPGQLKLGHSLTLTALYQRISFKLQKYYVGKHYGVTHEAEWEKWDSYAIRERSEPVMACLAEIAFEGLKTDQLILTSKLMKNVIKRHQEKLKQHTKLIRKECAQEGIKLVLTHSSFHNLLLAGFLAPLAGSKHSDGIYDCYFIHLTFQEYFAALHIVNQLLQATISSLDLTVATFIRQAKYDPRYEIVWWFTAGILHRLKTAPAHQALTGLFEQLNQPPRDILGFRHAILMARLLEECQYQVDDALKPALLQPLSQQLVAALRHSELQAAWQPYLPLCPLLVKDPGIAPVLTKAFEQALNQAKKDENRYQEIIQQQGQFAVLFTSTSTTWVAACLGHDNRNVRRAALRVLGQQAVLSPTMLEQVIAQLGVKDKYVHHDALGVLGKQAALSPAVLKQVIARLGDEDGSVHHAAVAVLDQQAALPPMVLEQVTARLEGEEEYVRHAALELLGQQAVLSPVLLEQVIARLGDKDWHVRRAALGVLREQAALSPTVLEQVIARLEDAALEQVIAQLGDTHVRRAALGVLGKQSVLSPTVLEQVIARLGDEDGSVRHAALEVLGKQSVLSPAVLEPIIARLGDEEGSVRHAALGVLGKQAALSPAVLEPIIARLGDKDWHVRRAALGVLGKQSMLLPTVLEQVIARLGDKDWHVRHAALGVLGKQSMLSPTVLEQVIARLGDKEEYVRQATLGVLGKQPESVDTWFTAAKKLPKHYIADIFVKATLERLLTLYQARPVSSLVPVIIRKSLEARSSIYLENEQLCFYVNKAVFRLEATVSKSLVHKLQTVLEKAYGIQPVPMAVEVKRPKTSKGMIALTQPGSPGFFTKPLFHQKGKKGEVSSPMVSTKPLEGSGKEFTP